MTVEAAPAAEAPSAPAAPPPAVEGAPPVVTEAAPPAPEVKPDDGVTKKLGKMARQEAALRERAAAFEAQQSAWEAQRKELEADAAEAKRFRQLKANPLAFAKEVGLTPQQILELAAKGDTTDPGIVAAIEEQKARAEALEKRLTEREAAERQVQQQQQMAQYQGRIEAMVTAGGERWEFAKAEGVDPSYVVQAAIEYVRANGVAIHGKTDEDRVFEHVLDRIEAWQEKQAEKLKSTSKWAKKFAPAPPPAPEAKKPATTSRTLTHASSSTPPPEGKQRKWSRVDDLALIKARLPSLLSGAKK